MFCKGNRLNYIFNIHVSGYPMILKMYIEEFFRPKISRALYSKLIYQDITTKMFDA